MRGLLKFTLAAPLALVAMSAIGSSAMAQQSADDIISALSPKGNLTSGATRGIKLGGEGHAAPAAAAPAVRPVATAAPQAHPAPAEKPEQASASATTQSVNLTVNFPSGSAELTGGAKKSLDALGQALSSSALANFKFRIEGHTDNVGSADSNRSLSQQRADAVVQYLSSQYHVDAARLQAVGMGQDQPLIETPPQTPEARNRRVQVINLGS